MVNLTINESICKSCGLCVPACPKKILELSTAKLNAKGYHPISCKDTGLCSACAACARICPDVVFRIEKN